MVRGCDTWIRRAGPTEDEALPSISLEVAVGDNGAASSNISGSISRFLGIWRARYSNVARQLQLMYTLFDSGMVHGFPQYFLTAFSAGEQNGVRLPGPES
jgi:hypothetical protein